MASDFPNPDEPIGDRPFASEGTGEGAAEQPRDPQPPTAYPAREPVGSAPFGSRMMPNDYPGGYTPYAPYQPPQPPRRTPLWVKLIGGCLIAGVLLTVALACVAGASAVAYFQSTPATSTATQTFTVVGAPTVRLHGEAGNIRVVRGDAGTVTVQATKYVRVFPGTDAQHELGRITVDVTQTSNTLDVQVSEPDNSGGIQIGWNDRHVNLTVTVPAQSNIAATLNAGNVDVSDIAGTVNIEDNAGNLSLDNVTLAGSSQLTDNAGNIDISGALQPRASLSATTNAGNVSATLPRATSAHLTASTDAGSISVDSVWPVSISQQFAQGTASGDLNPNPTGTLTLKTNAGDVTLEAQ